MDDVQWKTKFIYVCSDIKSKQKSKTQNNATIRKTDHRRVARPTKAERVNEFNKLKLSISCDFLS